MNERKTLPNIRFRNFKDEWKLVYLGDIGFFKSGIGFPRSEQGGKKGIPFYKVSDLGVGFKLELAKSKNYVTDEQIRNNKWKVIDPTKNGAVVFAKIGAAIFLNRKRMVKRPFLIDNNLMAYIMSDKVNREFVMNILQMINFSDFSQVGAIPSINSEELKKIKVRLPKEILQQKKIGDFFTKLDKLLDLQQQKIDKLELLKKALLQKLFPKYSAKIPELRFKGFEDDWKSYLLGKIAVFINGRAFKQNELLDKGKYPVLRVGNFYTNDKWFYSDLELPEKLYANKGDLLYTWSATFGPHIWKGDKVIYHYHIWKIIFSSEVSKQFALQMLLNDKEELMNNTNGSTMIHLTKNEMEKKVVKIPIKPEQQKIGNLLSKVDQLIELENKKLQNFQQVKKCLLKNMFVE